MNSRLRMRVYRTTHLLHWISAAVCFSALALFTITGITLNHASSIGGEPVVTTHAAQLPEALKPALAAGAAPGADVAPALAGWIEKEFGVPTRNASAEWSDEELYLSAPGPGRDAWVSIDRASGAAKSESTDRGWLAYFNDLHKGRNTGLAWRVFIDVFAAAVLFFSLTGLVLLQIQARQRKSTWPLVIGGTVLALVLMIFFIH
ncbi:MAG TPA: PepSY-associated TM helix domain-containing protein [Steroidobacteraceae bacterium]|nr:PepSY-associated TM helix domain-containing protein [Steroidobacteraceae bacterium]